MRRASQSLRRGGVRLRSIGSDQADLQMVISQVKEVRETAKAFAKSQTSAIQDLVAWSAKTEQKILRDTMAQVCELFTLWNEVQVDLIFHIKDMQHQFEKILDGEKQVEKVRASYNAAEAKVSKLKKEARKSVPEVSTNQFKSTLEKLEEAKNDEKIALKEVEDIAARHEVTKLNLCRNALIKISDGYRQYGQLCEMIFNVQGKVCSRIPEASINNCRNFQEFDNEPGEYLVKNCKEKVKNMKVQDISQKRNAKEINAPISYPKDPPPPYNPYYEYSPSNSISSQSVLPTQDQRLSRPRFSKQGVNSNPSLQSKSQPSHTSSSTNPLNNSYPVYPALPQNPSPNQSFQPTPAPRNSRLINSKVTQC